MGRRTGLLVSGGIDVRRFRCAFWFVDMGVGMDWSLDLAISRIHMFSSPVGLKARERAEESSP